MEKILKMTGKSLHETRTIDWDLNDKLMTLHLLTEYHPGSIIEELDGDGVSKMLQLLLILNIRLNTKKRAF